MLSFILRFPKKAEDLTPADIRTECNRIMVTMKCYCIGKEEQSRHYSCETIQYRTLVAPDAHVSAFFVMAGLDGIKVYELVPAQNTRGDWQHRLVMSTITSVISPAEYTTARHGNWAPPDNLHPHLENARWVTLAKVGDECLSPDTPAGSRMYRALASCIWAGKKITAKYRDMGSPLAIVGCEFTHGVSPSRCTAIVGCFGVVISGSTVSKIVNSHVAHLDNCIVGIIQDSMVVSMLSCNVGDTIKTGIAHMSSSLISRADTTVYRLAKTGTSLVHHSGGSDYAAICL